MKKIIVSAVLGIIPFVLFWTIFYIPHVLKITDLTDVWWGMPYIMTCFMSMVIFTILCVKGIFNLWE